MLELVILVGMIIGGMEIDSQPAEKKQVVKTVFKKAHQFTKEEQKKELEMMEINTVLRQMEYGQDELSRCPANKICKEVSDLEAVW